MADTEDTNDQVPSTPPNINNGPDPPQSTRQSTRLRTPMSRPGFIQTQTDSRRALVPNVPKPRQPIPSVEDENLEQTRESPPASVITQVAHRTGRAVVVDLAQDSDEDNQAAVRGKRPEKNKDKDGFDHSRLYFWPPGQGPKQDASSTAYRCRWCPGEFKRTARSFYNLTCHRDGANNKGTIRPACPGRTRAIAAGGNYPPTAAQLVSENAKSQPAAAGNLIAYTSKGRFDNDTLNRLIVIWMVRQSLPWLRIEDFLLAVCFDYAVHNSQLYSRVWAASLSHQLYIEQQAQVINAIKASDSQISLVSDVWTTKGSHKAFVGISACYIGKDWKYVCQHLAIKYISWHHNGKYLASPFANTTDSGSNNFTMATTVASIFRAFDLTTWDVKQNHHRCICHVIALILGAGLKALKLPNVMVRPEKNDHHFPVLDTIPEEADDLSTEDIVEVTEVETDDEEVDLDDAEAAVPEPGWEECEEDDYNECDNEGIGFTLKKIDYICRRIASSPQKQAEWKLWASKLGYEGRGVIGGYGIRWNIAYDSRQRAYEGRRVIKQMLENELDKYAGKASDAHFFKGYELHSREWEDVNSLNTVLKEFLEMTKRMEGDGPKLPMVLDEYVRLLEMLEIKDVAATGSQLQPMFKPMIKITKKYLALAINCDTVVMATFLHPAWRVMLFTKSFSDHFYRIESLINRVFRDREALLKSTAPISPPTKDSQREINANLSDSNSESDEFDFFPVNSDAVEVNTEMERYNNGVFPMEKKGDVLNWWK
ncbi:hypothetical protein H4Q26_011416, partial [Puccinia striiformis f. sp. tritici PST-130]